MKVSDLVDKHKGQLGFVVGAGPSLHNLTDSDISHIAEHPIIAVNSAIVKFKKSLLKNLYYLSDDIGSASWSYHRDLSKLNCTYLFYTNKLKDEAKHLDEDRVCWFKHKTWYSPETNTYPKDGLLLTKDEPLIGARTSSGTAVHFQYIFGVSKIILLGMDCCYYQNENRKHCRYFWQFLPENEHPYRVNENGKRTGEKVFSTPNAGTKSGQPIDSHCRDFLPYWNALAKQANSQNIEIINCSGGILEAFPRRNLNEVLEEYSSDK